MNRLRVRRWTTDDMDLDMVRRSARSRRLTGPRRPAAHPMGAVKTTLWLEATA